MYKNCLRLTIFVVIFVAILFIAPISYGAQNLPYLINIARDNLDEFLNVSIDEYIDGSSERFGKCYN